MDTSNIVVSSSELAFPGHASTIYWQLLPPTGRGYIQRRQTSGELLRTHILTIYCHLVAWIHPTSLLPPVNSFSEPHKSTIYCHLLPSTAIYCHLLPSTTIYYHYSIYYYLLHLLGVDISNIITTSEQLCRSTKASILIAGSAATCCRSQSIIQHEAIPNVQRLCEIPACRQPSRRRCRQPSTSAFILS